MKKQKKIKVESELLEEYGDEELKDFSDYKLACIYLDGNRSLSERGQALDCIKNVTVKMRLFNGIIKSPEDFDEFFEYTEDGMGKIEIERERLQNLSDLELSNICSDRNISLIERVLAYQSIKNKDIAKRSMFSLVQQLDGQNNLIKVIEYLKKKQGNQNNDIKFIGKSWLYIIFFVCAFLCHVIWWGTSGALGKDSTHPSYDNRFVIWTIFICIQIFLALRVFIYVVNETREDLSKESVYTKDDWVFIPLIFIGLFVIAAIYTFVGVICGGLAAAIFSA
jgi:hypothetical protein